MRQILAIIAALLLALLITGGVLFTQGRDIRDLFVREPETTETDLPTLPTTPQEEEEELNLSYEERLEKGDYYYERGFLTFASNEYVKAANLEPTRIEPYERLVDTHFELRNYKKALANAELILERNPNHLETRFKVILIHIKLSDFSKAQELIATYPSSAVVDAEVTYYKALLSSLLGSHELAKTQLKEALVASTDRDLDTKIQTIQEAYAEFEVTQAAEDLFRSNLLARAYNKVSEYEMAVHTLKDVLKTRGDLRDGWILLGFAYLNLEKYQFALTAFDKAYSLDSSWSTTQYFLGVTHKELGNKDDSIVYFNLALSSDFEPKIVIQSHLADLYFDTQDYEKAATAYEAVLEIDQDDVGAYVRPVWLYLDYVKDAEKALQIAQAAAVSFPESAMSYNLLGWSYIALNDDKRAESNLERAIEMDPNLAAAHLNLGTLKEKQGKDDDALESYQAAYDLDSNGSIGNMAAQKYNELLKLTLNE